MNKAGWVFRIEVITDKPATKTVDIKKVIIDACMQSENIIEVLVEELYEDIKLYKKEATAK